MSININECTADKKELKMGLYCFNEHDYCDNIQDCDFKKRYELENLINEIKKIAIECQNQKFCSQCKFTKECTDAGGNGLILQKIIETIGE